MEFYSEQACVGIELLDLLFDKNDGILCQESLIHRTDQPWPMQDPNMMMVPTQGSEDFFKALLNGADSVSGSPLWPPSPSDSGISEDPHSDRNDSPLPPGSPLLDPCYVFPHTHYTPVPNTTIAISPAGWESGILLEKGARLQHVCDVSPAQLANSIPLTIKDLLLTGAPELVSPSQPSSQDLVLNEDEKKLLVKEGVTLPSQLPLTKFEERILKKIRRKIRNKQSAQESRKKKKEYVDGLESRMAACNVENQELQRKVFQLEKCNMSLMEQLRRLQAMLMNGSNRPVQTRTCVLVLLLSFTLILLPSLKPFTETKVRQPEEFGPLRVQSRSLHSLQSSRVMHALEQPYSVAEKSKSVSSFPADEDMEDRTSLMAKRHQGSGLADYTLGSDNTSLDHQDYHHHVDPISGHITVTLSSQRGTSLQPHADNM